MKPRYLLDTNILSDLVRNPQGLVAQKISEAGEKSVCTSIIVASELRFGAKKLAHDLARFQNEGYTIVTWNGLSFDFNILAEEANERSLCGQLAFDHVDLMFHLLCAMGYLVSLQRAAEGMPERSRVQEV